MLRLLRFFSRLRYRVFGSKSLRPYEQTCFDGWRNSLSEQARKTLDRQLSLSYFVQRQAGDRKFAFIGSAIMSLFFHALTLHCMLQLSS